MTVRATRRRFVAIGAAAAGMALSGSSARARAGALHEWRGRALGARARITLAHPDAAEAARLIAACVDEIARLERVFSLHRPDSALARLNAAGRLDAPPFELVELLAEARRLCDRTGGAFDVTVQPLWQLHADHFGRAGADPAGPPASAIAAARTLVDYRALVIEAATIRLAKPRMAVTLNGIAQGYVTDRVADLLRAAGMTEVLLDLGEIRALGYHPSGRPWRVGLADPAARARAGHATRSAPSSRGVPLTGEIELAEAALATSSPLGTTFDATGRHHHLFDPATGRSARGPLQVAVLAPRATLADALSTALAVLPRGRALDLLPGSGVTDAWLITEDGRRIGWPA